MASSLTTLDYTYKVRPFKRGDKLNDYVKVPREVRLNKDFICKTVCLLTPPNACKMIMIHFCNAADTVTPIIIDDVQFASLNI